MAALSFPRTIFGGGRPRTGPALVPCGLESYKVDTKVQIFRQEPMADRSLSARPVPSRRPCLTAVLRMAGLRPTRQRVALAEILFGGSHRHVSAEQLHAEANAANVNVSLATIYNSLHQFRQAGLLREVAIDAARSYFDTDTSDHHHFYHEDEQRVTDIPASAIVIQNLPEPPKGMTITHVDVVVRVRKDRG